MSQKKEQKLAGASEEKSVAAAAHAYRLEQARQLIGYYVRHELKANRKEAEEIVSVGFREVAKETNPKKIKKIIAARDALMTAIHQD